MTGQVRESQAEDQKKLALKLYAIDNLQTFYKQNADSFWFRLFFPGRLARALNEDSYNFQEVYQAYFARSRWMRFFFGGYREVSMFTADDTSQKAFSILAKAGDLLVDDNQDQLNEFTKHIQRIKVESFLESSANLPVFADYFYNYTGMQDDPIRGGNHTITETTIHNLAALSDDNITKIYQIIQTVGKHKSRVNSTENWAFPILKVIIDSNKLDLLEVLHDLVTCEKPLVASLSIKHYTRGLLYLSEKKVASYAKKIRTKQMDQGSRILLLNSSITIAENHDLGRKRHLQELATAEKKTKPQAELKSANEEINSDVSSVAETDVQAVTDTEFSSVSSANTDNYAVYVSDSFAGVFLSNLAWWSNLGKIERESVKSRVASRSIAEQQILQGMCNDYGLFIEKETFIKILNLSAVDFCALESLITHLTGEKKPQVIVDSIKHIVDVAAANSFANKSVQHRFYERIKHTREALGVPERSSSSDSLTTYSNSSVDSSMTTELQELLNVINEFNKRIDLLDKLLAMRDFTPAVKIINTLHQLGDPQTDKAVGKLLELNESQINDVYQCLLILEQPSNDFLITFENLFMAIKNASLHTIFADLHQYDKLFSGEMPLDIRVLHVVLSNDRKEENKQILQDALQGYQTHQAALTNATSKAAGQFFSSAKHLTSSLGDKISSIMHHDSNKSSKRG